MSIQPLAFTGVSNLSDSLQEVLNRAVSIASIPLKQLQSANSDVLQKKVLLTGLGAAAGKLGTAVARLGTIASGGALSASSSDNTRIVVQNTGITQPVSYTITEISSIAKAASASTGVFATPGSTPVSDSGAVQLVVDGKTFNLTLAANNLNGLRDAINAAGAGVTATIVSAGSDQNYLSLSANSTGVLKSLKLLALPSPDPTPKFASRSLGSNGSAASASTPALPGPLSDPVSTTGSMQLNVGAAAYPFTLTDNSLNGLRDAINALGAGISATVITDVTGSRLSVSAGSVGRLSSLELIDDPGGAALQAFSSTNLGSDPAPATGMTAPVDDPLATPVSLNGTMQLVLGTQTHHLTLTDNSLTGLRDAINALGAGVTASVVAGETGSRLAVTADVPGEMAAFDLLDDPTGLATELLQPAQTQLGSNASFKLNGIPVEHRTNIVNSVVPGMTFRLLGTTTGVEQVTLNFSTDRSQLSTAISEFVAAYNETQDLVGQQVGANAGLLTGAFLVRDLQSNLRALAGYQADGAVRSLSEMGITFDHSGAISFDPAVLNALPDSGFQGALSFFGSAQSGFGALAKKFSQLTDPIGGAIKLEQDGFDRMDRTLQEQIAVLEERINAMQIATAQRLQVADALLAQLESQQSMIDASIQSVNLVLYGKKEK